MRVSELAERMGVSPRRVRTLIAEGRVAATKVGSTWEVTDPGHGVRGRRPLSARSRDQLSEALHHRSLRGLRGQDRARTAARIRLLRASPEPATLLIDWWGGVPDQKVNGGTNLVANAIAGNTKHVKAMLALRRELRRPEDLADLVSSERAIQGLSRRELAVAADVPLDVVTRLEHAQPVASPASMQRVLGVLDIVAVALPDLVIMT